MPEPVIPQIPKEDLDQDLGQVLTPVLNARETRPSLA